MKGVIALAILLSLQFATGCKEKPDNPVSEYTDTLFESRERSRRAADAANLQTLRSGLRAYRSVHGRYPEDLRELEGFMRSGIDPEDYSYDPATGTVRLK